MKNYLTLTFFLLISITDAFGQTKGETDKYSKESRPGFFHELRKTEYVCMNHCPIEIEKIMGIQVLCGNYNQEAYKQRCSDVGDNNPVEYCNCEKEICAKFKVSCSTDGITCQVSLAETGLKPASCECNTNTCAAPGGGFTQSACFMRRELDTKSCDIHRLVDFADGRSYHTACDEEETECQTEGIVIRSSDPNAAAARGQVPEKLSEPK